MKPCPGKASPADMIAGNYPSAAMVACESETLIKARSSMVRDVLTDSGNLTVWESGIGDVDGDLQDREAVSFSISRHGRTLRVHIRQNPARGGDPDRWLPLEMAGDLDDFIDALRHRAELLDHRAETYYRPELGRSPTSKILAPRHRSQDFSHVSTGSRQQT